MPPGSSRGNITFMKYHWALNIVRVMSVKFPHRLISTYDFRFLGIATEGDYEIITVTQYMRQLIPYDYLLKSLLIPLYFFWILSLIRDKVGYPFTTHEPMECLFLIIWKFHGYQFVRFFSNCYKCGEKQIRFYPVSGGPWL